MTEPNYNSAAALRYFLDARRLGMRKKFGQNFLINPNVRQALVNALEAQAGDSVWEIGPGLGAMTSLLLEQGLSVHAFEIDPGFARVLRELFEARAGFTLIEGDVLKTWPARRLNSGGGQAQLAAPYLLGNLPYNIAAVLLADFIELRCFFKRMVVTVQREVARRMAAGPGNAGYSSFSVLCASAYQIKPLMVIKSASFYPRPNVDSQAVLLELREDAAHAKPACFYPLVRRLFSSRRKTIKNNLAAFLPAQAASEALKKSSLDGGKRAEDLGIGDFEALAQTVENMGLL